MLLRRPFRSLPRAEARGPFAPFVILERIRALDCDVWQGYYGCAPQPAAELAARLAADSAIASTGLRAALTRASRLLGP